MAPESSDPALEITPIFIVNQPKIISPLTKDHGRSVGALLSAICLKEKDLHIDINKAVMLYGVSGDEGTAVPLNGPSLNEAASLPLAVDGIYHITARPANETYSVLINLMDGDSFWSGSFAMDRVSVRWTDNGRRLKEKIEAELKHSIGGQQILFDEGDLGDSESLWKRGITENSVLYLKISIRIEIQYKGRASSVYLEPKEAMNTALYRVSLAIHEALPQLRFLIIKFSGAVAGRAREWLVDRNDIFAAEDAAGTLEENGCRDGDEVQVYRVLAKEEKHEIPKKRQRRSQHTT